MAKYFTKGGLGVVFFRKTAKDTISKAPEYSQTDKIELEGYESLTLEPVTTTTDMVSDYAQETEESLDAFNATFTFLGIAPERIARILGNAYNKAGKTLTVAQSQKAPEWMVCFARVKHDETYELERWYTFVPQSITRNNNTKERQSVELAGQMRPLKNTGVFYSVKESSDLSDPFRTNPTLASDVEIISFKIEGQQGPSTIAPDNSTVQITMPAGTDLTRLSPEIEVSPGAISKPGTLVEQDFTNPVTYTILAEDGTKQLCVVTVTEGV